jgi:hypothetical protein
MGVAGEHSRHAVWPRLGDNASAVHSSGVKGT